jgi:hypothetical protein
MKIILDARLHLGYAKHAIVHAKPASVQPGSYLTTQGLDGIGAPVGPAFTLGGRPVFGEGTALEE